jgi:ligand-binding sensor domain-containing protein
MVLIPFFILAQNQDEDIHKMDHGSNEVTWHTYATDGPALCFAISPTHLWFSNGNAVGNYDLKTNHKAMYPTLGDIPASGIKTIGADENGDVWFGGNNGVILYSENKFSLFTKKDGLSDNTINKIKCISNSVWIGTNNGITEYVNRSWITYTTAQGVCGNNIRDITSDNQGTVYFATNNGIAYFNNNTWSKFDRSNGTSSNNVKAIGYDSRTEVLWAAMGVADVDNYNGKEWNTYMDIQENIVSIMTDTQSRIWFGSMNGITKYNGFAWVTDPKKIGFSAAQVTDMYRDNKGDLFFAVESGIMHMKNPYPF